jgi:ficolin
MKFTTKDKDYDTRPNANCAVVKTGAWWYHTCYNSNLNGRYIPGGITSHWQGMIWFAWKGRDYSVKFSEMKVRRN